MILNFAQNKIETSFEDGYVPRLLTASNITVKFSQHPRILHNHIDRLELLYVHTGSGLYIVDDETFQIKPGNIIVTNPGALHDEVPKYNRQLSMLSISVDNVRIKGLPENHLIPDNIKPVLKADKHTVLIDAIFQEIYNSITPPPVFSISGK